MVFWEPDLNGSFVAVFVLGVCQGKPQAYKIKYLDRTEELTLLTFKACKVALTSSTESNLNLFHVGSVWPSQTATSDFQATVLEIYVSALIFQLAVDRC